MLNNKKLINYVLEPSASDIPHTDQEIFDYNYFIWFLSISNNVKKKMWMSVSSNQFFFFFFVMFFLMRGRDLKEYNLITFFYKYYILYALKIWENYQCTQLCFVCSTTNIDYNNNKKQTATNSLSKEGTLWIR